MKRLKIVSIGVVVVALILFAYYFISRQSKHRDYYEDGSLKMVYSVKDGKIDGPALEYFQSGVLKSNLTFKSGVQDGPAVFYYEDGPLKSRTYFRGGLQSDSVIFYRKNGRIQEVCTMKNGMRDGLYKDYFENGQLNSSGKIRMNKRDGIWKFYDEHGDIVTLGNYVNDTLVSFMDYEEGKSRYANKILKYNIYLPNQWFIEIDSMNVVLFAIKDHPELKESIEIRTVKIGGLTLAKYVNDEVNELSRVFGHFSLSSETRLKLKTLNAVQIQYSASIEGNKIEVITLFVEKANSFIVITCLALEDNYNEYSKGFQEVLQSFEVSG